ncbi:MAG: carbohydrate binding family 9 domain-containing protein, partial [Bacteroidetes bacterium]|nr:carbohydrate binding family 9 domain-containing protein [Fibrella sp.]
MLLHLHRLFLLACCWLFCHVAAAQTLTVSPTDSTIRVDGLLTESVWQRATVASDFIQNFPNDTLKALNQTEVRMTYDRNYLYIGVICHDQTRNKRFVAGSLKRDFDWDANDNFSVYIDSFGDRINGFTFQLTPLGVEREGQMFNGENVASEWDNKWRSSVKLFDDRWQGEMMIPLKSIRYRQGAGYFLINF